MRLERFERQLRAEEKSQATVAKYIRDTKAFLRYIGDAKLITKERVIAYKQYLSINYKVSSANSMLAAVNSFLRFIGYTDCGKVL